MSTPDPPPEPSPPPPPEEPTSASASQQLHQESSAAAVAVEPESSAAAPEPEPEPETQEPDGPRSQRLRTVFQKALSKTISTVNYENFAQCFPTTATRQPQIVHGLHAAMVKNIQEKSNIEFDKILKERNVIAKLNALDRMLTEAEQRQRSARPGEMPVAPSTLPPTAVVTAHLTPLLRAAQERMLGMLQETRDANDKCVEEITRQREEMRELVKRLEEPRVAFEGAVEEVQTAVQAEGMELDL